MPILRSEIPKSKKTDLEPIMKEILYIVRQKPMLAYTSEDFVSELKRNLDGVRSALKILREQDKIGFEKGLSKKKNAIYYYYHKKPKSEK